MNFLKDITLGQYYPADSILHRLDPRSKLFATLLILTGLMLTTDLVISGAALFAIASGAAVARLPGRLFLKNLRPFVWLFALTYFIHLIYTDGLVIYTLPLIHMRISLEGVTQGTIYCLRLICLVLLSALLTSTTSPIDLTDGLVRWLKPLGRLHLHVQDFSTMLALALRFVPTLVIEADRIQKAQVARGANFEGNPVRRLPSLVPLLVPLFISVFRRADELALAMEARCYSSGEGRTNYRVLHWSARDAGLMLGSIAFFLWCVLR